MGVYGRLVGGKEIIETVRTKTVRWNDRPKTHSLLCCPKCGSERADIWYVGAGAVGGWRGICHDCQHTPDRLCMTEQEAVDLWNGVIT